ncbi:MAG: hypothetical protein JXA71_14085 [Chitinispirillaceae bacterium]|nr:hypothetical protein [Chitinispirillaceae bacterium]
MKRLANDSVMVVVWAISLAVIIIMLKRSFGILISDDAYITLSHVKTWVQTGRPVMSMFNPVCATSTPLYTILITSLNYCFRIDPVFLAYGINSLLDFVNIALLYGIGRRSGMTRLFSASAATLFGLSILTLGTSASGMETILYCALVLAGFYLVLGAAPPMRTCGILFLLALTRPEGIIAAVSIVIIGRLRAVSLRTTVVMLAAAILGLIALLLFYYAAYGNFLPHSVIAKHAGMNTPYFDAIGFWWNTLFFGGPAYGGRRCVMAGNLLFISLGIFGLIIASRKKSRTVWMLLIWPVLYFCFFMVTRSSHQYFTWYYLPVLPFLSIVSSFGLQEIGVRLRLRRWRFAGWLLLILFCGIVFYRDAAIDSIGSKYRKAHQEREKLYQRAAEFLADSSSPASSVMIEEVGTVGYYLPRHILDRYGIISPEVIRNGLGDPMKLKTCFSPGWIICHSGSPGERPGFILPDEYQLRLSLPHFNAVSFLQIWSRSSP